MFSMFVAQDKEGEVKHKETSIVELEDKFSGLIFCVIYKTSSRELQSDLFFKPPVLRRQHFRPQSTFITVFHLC